MNTPGPIPTAPPERTSMNYSALREEGMEWIRQWARDTWTDHNEHDPGITLLEAVSYAMTELGLRLRLDMADILRSGEIHGPADLEPAHRVLPCGPVTPQDLRKLLLDHPLVRDAQISLAADSEIPLYESTDPTAPLTFVPGGRRVQPRGLYEVVVELAERELNSNTYGFRVSSDGEDYEVELALPHWDEDEAKPFREAAGFGGPNDGIAMREDGGVAWRLQPEARTYFGQIDVDYSDPDGGSGSTVLWMLLRIATPLQQPAQVTPGILDEVRNLIESAMAGSPILRFAERVRDAYRAVRQLERYLSLWRNLGEEAVRIRVVRVQEIALRARLEVTGGTVVEDLLAAIFADIDAMLSPHVVFRSLAEQRAHAEAAGGSADSVYDGPLPRQGFLDAETLSATQLPVLHASDILRLIMRRRSGSGTDLVAQENPGGRDIVAVTDLALSNFIDNRAITVGAPDCLRLVEIERYRPRLSLAKSRLIPVRNGAEIAVDAGRVESLLLSRQNGPKTTPPDPSPIWPVLQGEAYPVEDYTPLQNDLPSLYGVGEAALPDSAGPERRAAALQLKGYLLLFEQFLADLTAQMGHINRFFSADAAEETTYFGRPLSDIPGVAALFRQDPAGGDWPPFAEDRDRYLDRRNRMLDHRLARLGEDTAALGQEIHRWAQRELLAGTVAAPASAAMAERRRVANARLVHAKADLLRDAPELSAFRLLAQGNPLWSDAGLPRIDSTGAGYRWTLMLEGREQLRSIQGFTRSAAAAIAAEDALWLAGRADLYAAVAIGGGRYRYQLRDGADGTARVVAESPLTWASAAAAETAASAVAAGFAALRLASSLSPMERRVAHLTGIRGQNRRRLLVPESEFFEIYDEVDSDGIIEKRWRLWELPGRTGQVLLSSPFHFEDATDSPAIAQAQASIQDVLRYGIDEWNYRVSPAGASTYNFDLRDPADRVLALRNTPWNSERETGRRIHQTLDHLYRSYSAEGFHLVEHLLLRPRRTSDSLLSLPAGAGVLEPDPYSQRLSLFFPSGHARDFSLPRNAAPSSEVAPHRFRDPEFRSHAERMVQQACPAHLLPTVYWVDRQASGTPDSPASFDRFEARYFAWLDTVLIPGAPAANVRTARDELVETLNAIAQGL